MTDNTVLKFRTAEDAEHDEAKEVFCGMLDELAQQVRDGSVRRVVIVSDGDDNDDRMRAQYNRFIFGRMRKAEMLGLLTLGITMEMTDE